MYDYQSQTSLPPIRARQQRPAGVQVQQLYESSPVLAAISHHPTNTHYTSHKLQHTEPSTINGNSTVTNNTNGTTNGYHHHHHNGTSHVPNQPQTSEQSLRKSPSVDSMLSLHSTSQRRTNALDPDTAMKTYMPKLTAYERHEIFSYPQIYFVGQNARKRQGVGGGPNNGKGKKQNNPVIFLLSGLLIILIDLVVTYFYLKQLE